MNYVEFPSTRHLFTVMQCFCFFILSSTVEIMGNKQYLTMYARLVETPVYTQAVLLSLHATSALAAMQRAGQQSRHSIGTLAACTRAQLHAAVSGHTLTQGPEARAACLITGA